MRQFFCAAFRRSCLLVLATISLLIVPFSLTDSFQAQSAASMHPGSTSIRTPDFDETIRWYRDNLDFRVIVIRNLVPGKTAVLERNGFLLEVTEADHPMPPSPGLAKEGRPVTRVPIISLLVPDVDEEVEFLRARGVDILQPPEDDLDGSYRTAQIRDNGRHRIELREPLGSPADFHANGR